MGEMKRLNMKWIGVLSFIFAVLISSFYPSIAAADQDVTAPTLENLEVILPEKEVLDVGDTIKIRAKITDISGVGYAQVSLAGTYQKTIALSLNPVNEQKDTYEGEFTFQSNNPRGIWYIEGIFLRDKFSNYTSLDNYGLSQITDDQIYFDFGYKGVANYGTYNYDVTPKFNGQATLNGVNFSSGQTISTDGKYTLDITEPNGEHSTVSFLMDKIAPIITGVEDNGIYKDSVTISHNEGYGSLSKKYYDSYTSKGTGSAMGTVSEEGSYYIYVSDNSGNITEKYFIIDRSKPIVYHVVSTTQPTNSYVNIQINSKDDVRNFTSSGLGQITLPNGNKVENNGKIDYKVTENGTYTFKVSDKAGNILTKSIVVKNIDKTAPTVTTSLSNTKVTNKDVYITVTGSDSSVIDVITLPDGKTVKGEKTAKYKATKNGSYTFKVQDRAGNSTSKTVKVSNIDKTAPKVESSLSTNKATNKDVEIKVTGSDSSKIENITLPNKKTVKSSSTKYKVSKNGSYTFKVKDKAGNVTSKTVKVSNIDKSAPGKPSVNKVTSKSKTVTGKAEKNATVYVYNGKKNLGKADVNSKGAYTVKISAQKKNTKLSVYVQDKAGNKGKSVAVTVK